MFAWERGRVAQIRITWLSRPHVRIEGSIGKKAPIYMGPKPVPVAAAAIDEKVPDNICLADAILRMILLEVH